MKRSRALTLASRLASVLAPRPAPLDPRPFALTFTAGVGGIHLLATLPGAAACTALSLPALLPWRGRWLWSGFALGLLLSVWHAQQWLASRWPEAQQGEQREITGRIASLPSQDGIAQHFLFEPDAALAENRDLPQRIRAGWYRSEVQPQAGECWRLQLRLRAPRGSLNPGGFDYEAWLYRQNVGAAATVHSGIRCGAAPAASVLRLRAAIRSRFEHWLPGEPGRGLVEALTIGDQSELGDADWDIFRLTGTSHLVAVSGFNIAIVAAVVYFPLRALWSLAPMLCLWLPAQRAGAIGAALVAAGYAAIAGLEAPVARATIMVLLALLAALLTRRAALSRLMALAWIAVLAASPAAVLSPGVWLSFGAVAGIAWVSAGRIGPIEEWRQGLSVQLMLSLALAPLGLYFFAGLSWIAPLVNLLAVPLIAVLTPVLVAAVLLAWLWPAFGVPLLGTATEVVWRLRESLAWLAAHAPEPWLAASPPPLALLLAAIGALALFAPRGLPTRMLGVALLLPLFVPPAAAVRSGFRIAVLDVGQGLATVVQTSRHSLLFDAGPAYRGGFDAGESVVAPYLLHQGIRRLDLLIVSHRDLDHRGGVPAVRRLLKPRREIGALSDIPCVDGQHWRWDGVDFAVLHPDGGQWSRNNGGCVLRVAAGPHAALLPADIEAPAEQRLLQKHALQLRADLLIAPHHGSKTSSTPDFVAAVAPKAVTFAAGFANIYHLPRADVVERYRRRGADEQQTGLSGMVEYDIDAQQGITAEHEWRREARRFWNGPALPLSD